MDFQKIFGGIIIFVGIAIIFWTLYASYNNFAGKSQFPELFKFEVEKGKEDSGQISLKPEELQKEIGQIVKNQMREIIPLDFIAKIFNLISWSVFSAIFIFGGSKISEIGIKLIKK
jgi:hypothetical protein